MDERTNAFAGYAHDLVRVAERILEQARDIRARSGDGPGAIPAPSGEVDLDDLLAHIREAVEDAGRLDECLSALRASRR